MRIRSVSEAWIKPKRVVTMFTSCSLLRHRAWLRQVPARHSECPSPAPARPIWQAFLARPRRIPQTLTHPDPPAPTEGPEAGLTARYIVAYLPKGPALTDGNPAA